MPSAALVFPFPSPVWTMISPLRRRAAAILLRISFCKVFISSSCSFASVIGELQMKGSTKARAHSEDFENGGGTEHFFRTAVGDQPAAPRGAHLPPAEGELEAGFVWHRGQPPPPLEDGEGGQRPSLHLEVAAGRQESRRCLEQRRLAAPIRTDDGRQGTGPQREGHA